MICKGGGVRSWEDYQKWWQQEGTDLEGDGGSGGGGVAEEAESNMDEQGEGGGGNGYRGGTLTWMGKNST